MFSDSFYRKTKLLIQAMAFERKKAISSLNDISWALGTHMAYLFTYPEAQEANHWAKEISALMLKSRALLRTKSGKLAEEHYYEALTACMSSSEEVEELDFAVANHMDSDNQFVCVRRYQDFAKFRDAVIRTAYSRNLTNYEVLELLSRK